MRHADRIFEIFSDAIQRAMKEHGGTQTPTAEPYASPEVCEIWKAAEAHGAYAVVDRMLFRFGKYRLTDCSANELANILAVINDSLVSSTRRMPVFPSARLHVAPPYADKDDEGVAG